MQKLWRTIPKLNYPKEVIEIVQFGSSVKENPENKPNDIDIAVIFKSISLKEQLNTSQDIKRQLQKYSDLPIHIKSYDLYTLFDKSNFAKESIIFNGKSLISGDYFAKLFGFTPFINISYNLKHLKKKDKVRFNYLLNGKGGKYGLLRKYYGRLIAPGLIEIKPEYELFFIDSIKKITPNFKVRKILSF